MPDLSFDHIHAISRDPEAAAAWYVEKLGGEEVDRKEIGGAPQIYIQFPGATIIVRGQRTGEAAQAKTGLQWGADHFGFRVEGNLEARVESLRAKGVEITVEPRPSAGDPSLKIAYIRGPDAVSIELLERL